MDLIILKSFIPEIFLSLCVLFQLVFNAYLINNLRHNFPIVDKEIFWQTAFILFCLLLLLINSKIEGYFSNFIFLNDSGTRYIKILFVCSCLSVLLILIRSFKLQKLNFFEYFTIFLLSILSLLLLISASDMLSAYLVIEMQALAFYILASFRRNSAFSTEAGLKYFISGSFISGIFLFGCSLIYGTLGTLNFNHLHALLVFPLETDLGGLSLFLIIGILMVTITFLFKVSAVPFHFWSPDVYEGAPLASTVIFSIIPKLALFHFFIKWLTVVSESFYELKTVLLISGLLSVFLGAFFAIRQKRLKRLVIYSSIAQVGFLIAALSVNSVNSLVGVYFFLIIYIITSVLVWTHFSNFYSFQEKSLTFFGQSPAPLFLSSLSNFFKINKLWSVSFVIIFFSIAGIPPLSGFLSKIFILFGLIESDQIVGSLLLILISAMSVFYYLRIIKVMFFESKNYSFKHESVQIIFNSPYFSLDCLLIATFLFLLLFFFFYPSYLLLICHNIVLGSFYF